MQLVITISTFTQ